MGWIVIGILVASQAACIAYDVTCRRQRKNRFKDRLALPWEAWRDAYYRGSLQNEEFIRQTLEYLAGEMDLDVGRLRPEDSFDVEYQAGPRWVGLIQQGWFWEGTRKALRARGASDRLGLLSRGCTLGDLLAEIDARLTQARQAATNGGH